MQGRHEYPDFLGEETGAEGSSNSWKGTKVSGSGEQKSLCHLSNTWMVKLKAKMSFMQKFCTESLSQGIQPVFQRLVAYWKLGEFGPSSEIKFTAQLTEQT